MRLLGYVALLLSFTQSPSGDTPAAAAERLIDTDRSFGASAAGRPAVEALAAMFADDVTVPAPGNVFVQGKAGAIEALKANSDKRRRSDSNGRSRNTAAPMR